MQAHDEYLESELLQIVQDSPRPVSLDEIFSCLYQRRDRIPDLMAVSKETILEKRRVQRHLEQSTYRGYLTKSRDNGEILYAPADPAVKHWASSFRLSIVREKDRIAFSSQPLRFHAQGQAHDRLLVVFCIVATAVMLAVIAFLMSQHF